MKKILAFAVPILVCLLLGYLAGLIQADSIREWYPTLRKPPLTPPNIVFPIAWGILYLCMGISAGLIYLSSAPQRDFLIRLFCRFFYTYQRFCLTATLFFLFQHGTKQIIFQYINFCYNLCFLPAIGTIHTSRANFCTTLRTFHVLSS